MSLLKKALVAVALVGAVSAPVVASARQDTGLTGAEIGYIVGGVIVVALLLADDDSDS